MALISQLFGSSADLATVAAGGRTIRAPETSDSVALVQQALVATGFSLARAGVDDNFGTQTGDAVVDFKSSRGLIPADAVVGVRTSTRLDLEIAYLEGNATADALNDDAILASDPLFAGVLDRSFPAANIDQRVRDVFQFGDRLCFRLSFIVGPPLAKEFGRFVEPPIFKDYCTLLSPCTTADFADATSSSTPYVDFLLNRHPGVDTNEIRALGGQRRPDILSDRTPTAEWYEIKPVSIAGAIAAWRKFNTIIGNYSRLGLPYVPGRLYTPTEEIPLIALVTPQGENLDVILHVFRNAPGLIFYEFCVKGDYVLYFNRVRLLAGILAILVAIPELLPAAADAGVVAAVREIALGLGVSLPILTKAP